MRNASEIYTDSHDDDDDDDDDERFECHMSVILWTIIRIAIFYVDI